MPLCDMLPQPIEPSAEVMADIRARLGPICAQYPPDEFNEIVRQIALVRTKYDALRLEAFFGAARRIAAERDAARSSQGCHSELLS